MKSQTIKLVAFLTLLAVSISCTDDRSDCDCGCPEGAIEVTNSGKTSSFFTIDDNIISFALPHVLCIFIHETPSIPTDGGPNAVSPHYWTITPLMPERTDFTKLAPIITLAPGAKINSIYTNAQGFKYVDYTGIAKIGATDFSKQVDIQVIAPDGSTVTYTFIARLRNDFRP